MTSAREQVAPLFFVIVWEWNHRRFDTHLVPRVADFPHAANIKPRGIASHNRTPYAAQRVNTNVATIGDQS